MATNFQMLAKSSADAALHSWISTTPDWSAAGYVAAGYPGSPLDIALAGGGLDTGSATPDKAITLTDGSFVTLTDGSFATTT